MSISPSLATLYDDHHGKISDKWTLYLEAYDRHFAPYRDKHVNILEIGIQNGGSLEIWPLYFQNAGTIIGADINPLCSKLRFDDQRIHVVVGDAGTDAVASSIETIAKDPFDIIIDDGSHRSSDTIRNFSMYFPRLNPGGIYIIEDMHCSYWSEFEGGLYDPMSSVSFGKRLVDLVSHEHWQEPYTRAESLAAFASTYGTQFLDVDLTQIDSVQFSNSLIVIHKRRWQTNGLGKRRVVGNTATVDADAQRLRDSGDESALLSTKPVVVGDEKTSKQPIEIAYKELLGENEELNAECQFLEDELENSKRALIAIQSSTFWKISSPIRNIINNIRK